MGILTAVDEKVHNSFIGKYFEFEKRGATFSTELKGATTSFLTLAYILAVNPRILADSGGPCVPPDGNLFAPEYMQCMDDLKKEYITAT